MSKFYVVTIFPEFVESFSQYGIIRRAADSGLLDIKAINLRDYAKGKYRKTDDNPYGGGPGMLMKPEPPYYAISSIRKNDPDVKVFLMTPKGTQFTQKKAAEIAKINSVCLICGRYEGFDERIREMADGEISVGKYILSGGEIAACAVIDAAARLIPGVVGNEESLVSETYGNSPEYPQYTRPAIFKGMEVPEILLSGNHAKIRKWREDQSLE